MFQSFSDQVDDLAQLFQLILDKALVGSDAFRKRLLDCALRVNHDANDLSPDPKKKEALLQPCATDQPLVVLFINSVIDGIEKSL